MTSTTARKYRLLTSGAPLDGAEGAMILLHGRGGSASDILSLGAAIAPSTYALLAPEKPEHTWYPYSFLAPRAENEPALSASLETVRSTISGVIGQGISAERVILAGFSQGACLATEFACRNPLTYGGVLAFTGALIGPLDEPIELEGDLGGTPVLLSSGDPDPHVPWYRVQQSAELIEQIGGRVTVHRYPGRPHTIIPSEITEAKQLLRW